MSFMWGIVGVNDIHCRYECHLLCGESKGCRSLNVWFAKRLACWRLKVSPLGNIHIIFVFPFVSLLCDTVGGCCWGIASIMVSVRRSSIKVLRCRLYVIHVGNCWSE